MGLDQIELAASKSASLGFVFSWHTVFRRTALDDVANW
jgi:hypothetical protein